ncbi:ATP-binding cassette sub- G member 1 [Tyrophagus putrescentiae]|nr:ATP-binding cassette sub- G member 1 [Tyrophagus putrescentiae]
MSTKVSANIEEPRLLSDDTAAAASTTSDQGALHLYWKNLNCQTPAKKVLVNNLNGHLQSGRLTAVLGPSGSGKTTLFECLAKRKVSGVTGQFWASSSTSDIKDVRIIYNPQHDCLFSVLSPRESMLYACQLQKYTGQEEIDLLQQEFVFASSDGEAETGPEGGEGEGPSTSRSGHQRGKAVARMAEEGKEAENRVNDLIDLLGLTSCADVRVAHCSGGQKKRLSIALELIFSPNVLLLDEPTTGLDSVSSLQMVQLLKSLVRSHPVIICASIHQPSAKLFSYFDHLYVISSQGTCIYHGPREELLPFLQGYNLNCPIFHNIADFALEVASCLHGEEVVHQLAAVEMNREVVDPNRYRVHINIDRTLSKKMAFDQLNSSLALFKRSSIIALREPFNYGLRGLGLLMIMAVRLILRNRALTIIDDECFNSTNRDIILLITSIMFTVIISLIPSLMLFPLELSVFIKEHSNRWYTRWSYYVAKSVADIPPTLIFPLIYAVFTYFLIEAPPGWWRFVAYIAVIVATSLLAHSFAMVISVFFINNTIAALIVGAMLFVPFFIFSGFIIPINKLPVYVRPFTYISIYKLAIESILIIFYGFDRCGSSNNALKVADFTEYLGGGLLNISNCITESTSLPSIHFLIDSYNVEISKINQSIILSRFELRDVDLFINFGLIVGYTLVLRLLAYFALKWKSIAK